MSAEATGTPCSDEERAFVLIRRNPEREDHGSPVRLEPLRRSVSHASAASWEGLCSALDERLAALATGDQGPPDEVVDHRTDPSTLATLGLRDGGSHVRGQRDRRAHAL